jgi:flagellar FliL protein
VADDNVPQGVAPKKKSKRPLIIGGALALALAGGGFYASFSGLILSTLEGHAPDVVAALPDIAFVPVQPLVISLGEGATNRHLRFTSQLEVAGNHSEEVTLLLPRIMDVMNSYLRAIEVAALEDPAGLVRMRAQMLRRIQMVTGEGRVRDLLVTEFVLN